MTDKLKITIPDRSFMCKVEGYNIPHYKLREQLSYEVPGSEFSPARQEGRWDGFEYLYEYKPAVRTEGTFPLGLLSKVCSILSEENVLYEIIDLRVINEKSIHTELNVNLRDYQEKAVNVALEKGSGILNIATGGGKCVKDDTLIPTNDGILPISYFKKMDYPIQLKSKSEIVFSDELYDGGIKNTIKITTNSGYSIEGTYNHPVLILNNDYHLVFKQLQYVEPNDVIVIQYNTKLFGVKSIYDFIPFLNSKIPNIEYNIGQFISYFLEYGNCDLNGIKFYVDNATHPLISNIVQLLFPSNYIEVNEKYIFIKDKGLSQLFNSKLENKIPIFLLQLQKRYLYEFIKHYIHLFKNEHILKTIQTILLNFGVISKLDGAGIHIINKNHFYQSVYSDVDINDTFLFYKNDLVQNIFKNMISNFPNEFQLEDLSKLTYHHLFDILSKNKSYDHYEFYKTIDIISKDLYFFETVAHKDYSYSQVYDFVVPKNHSFVGNGFVNHNTKTSTGLIHRLGRKTVFYVHTIDLLDQAKEEFEKTLGIPIGQVGGGIVDIKDITVATIQTVIMAFDQQYKSDDSEMDKGLLKEDVTDISNCKEDIKNMVENAEVIFFDECQHLGAESFYEIAKKSYNASFRYGLSATPWRDDGKEIYIEAGLGEIIYRLSASWLIENGHLVQPHIKFYSGQQPNSFSDFRPYQTIYREDIVENERRNMLACQVAISVMKKNKTSLIIIQQKKHGELLRDIFKNQFNMDVPFVHGGTTKKKRRHLLAQFKRFYEPEYITHKDGSKELETICPIMICSTIADEGLDIPHLSTVVMAGGGKSTTRILQRVGRAIRLYTYPDTSETKNAAFVVDFMDNSKYLRDHSMVRLSTMQKEPAFIIK